MDDAPQAVFIVSTGRTGTKFLARYFNANFESIRGSHEPPPRIFRLLSNAHVAGALPSWVLEPLFHTARRRAFREAAGGIYLESNNFIYGFFDVLAALDPPPLIMHVVRDPRAYVRSIVGHGSLQGGKFIASRLLPYWYARVRREFGPLQTPVGRFAGQWTLVNRFLDEKGAAYPHYHRLRFEDVFDETESGLRELCEILGLPYPGPETRLPTNRKVNRSQRRDIGAWPAWPVEWAAELHRISTPLMQSYGYGFEPEWLDMLGLGGLMAGEGYVEPVAVGAAR